MMTTVDGKLLVMNHQWLMETVNGKMARLKAGGGGKRIVVETCQRY